MLCLGYWIIGVLCLLRGVALLITVVALVYYWDISSSEGLLMLSLSKCGAIFLFGD